ncbi:branched-chain amino acid ABC transporter permease [Candidatus Halobonum tyrrellensis]|uniref:ABC-type branched-chain amino acid transport system, permease II n=1 Tax=Candidatus Halobonum tyrrellensis G22 TaxID=1324957 RepID=V4HF16_9EURY|nr:branched-chain amino acid ABC transporter permease [Candidatus Halobonum tyrrellensis]ESP88703.1 ABC-type branched-chain amino acid transport system, permease II [Candidatus Halobonum tyrrellensis G22]
MSDDATAGGPVEARLPAWAADYWANDLVKIGATLAAVYAVYLVIGALLGYDLSGQLNSLRRLTFLIVLYSIAALVVNLHWGYSGLFNIGVVGFMATGVYTTTMLSRPLQGQNPTGTLPGLGLPFPVAVVGGVLAAAAVGYVAALPSLRLRDDYFAIVTLAFAEIIRITVKASELQEFTVFGVTLGTGGGRGIRTYPNPVDEFFAGPGQPVVEAVSALGVDGSLVAGWAFVLVLVVLLAGVYLLITRLAESPFGRVLKAIRDDEQATLGLAKDTASFKIRAFIVGCAVLGLLGIVWQGSQGYVSPSLFIPQLTFFIWIAVIVGGAGSNTGSIVGTILFVGVVYLGPDYLRRLVEEYVSLSGSVPTFPGAVGALAGGDPQGVLLYTLDQTSTLRVVLTGVFLVWLLRTNPDGLFGDRREIASSIDLEDRVERRRARGDADGQEGGGSE